MDNRPSNSSVVVWAEAEKAYFRTRPVGLKFELTNHDSAGGKNRTVLKSMYRHLL